MPKVIPILALLCLFATPVFALPGDIVILQATDPSPPTTICDLTHGDRDSNGLPSVRPCYIPLVGPDDSDAGPFLPAHSGRFPPITVTFAQDTVVEIEYAQVAFLSTQHGPFPMYATAVSVDQNICGISSAMNLDSPGSTGFTLISRCIVTVSAGMHSFFALERARRGASAFNAITQVGGGGQFKGGSGNQLLTIRYQE